MSAKHIRETGLSTRGPYKVKRIMGCAQAAIRGDPDKVTGIMGYTPAGIGECQGDWSMLRRPIGTPARLSVWKVRVTGW